MRRDWNSIVGPAGSGRRYAQALGCLSTEPYVQSVIAVHQGLLTGHEAHIRAVRGKFGAEGQELSDHREPGDYLTVGYEFGAASEEWSVDRETNFEGERAAEDYADAFGQAADRDFCEAMVQVKCLLDRIGGEAILRPFVRPEDNAVVGFLYHYQHLVRGQPKEPDAELEEPPEEPAEDESPEEPAAPTNGVAKLSEKTVEELRDQIPALNASELEALAAAEAERKGGARKTVLELIEAAGA